jgi:DNA-3-methyladenine glycosylase II
MVARAIVYQQLSGSAAATIHGRMRALLADGADAPRSLLALKEDHLRAAGLSRQKIAYLRDLARRVGDGSLPISALDDLADADVVEALTAVHGVGEWTAQMFLIFRLGRPDVLPVLDYGIRKAVQRAYRLRTLPDAKRMRAIGASWSPFSSIACWYLWRSLDLDGAATSPPRTRQAAAR